MIAISQTIPITVKITNLKNEPVAFATIKIFNWPDSTQVQQKIADSSGLAKFSLTKSTQYNIQVSAVNHGTIKKGFSITGNQTGFIFTLEPLSKKLENVIVKSKKPLMRQEDDKMIIDPENLVASSTNGYEVLEKVPGLFLDQDGNVYLTSATPATIYINGREMKMSAADVATMLKSLPPNSIDKIEVLRTPSAKYDASGSGGIVNIVLKKGVKLGRTGSITAGYQQGVYSNEFISLNMSNNNDKRTSYFNLQAAKRNSFENVVTNRLFSADSLLSQDAYTVYPAHNYFAGYGVTQSVSKKWEIDFSGNIRLNEFDNKTNNRNIIQKLSTSQILTDNLNRISNKGSNFGINNSLEGKMKLDTIGSEWETQVGFTYSHNKTDQGYNTVFTVPVLPVFSGYGSNENDRSVMNIQSDLKKKLKNKFTLEAGIKSSILQFKSKANYFRKQGSADVKDFGRTNTFHYNENINAAYLQGSKSFGKDFILKTGVRLENTNMKGHQLIPGDTSFNIKRTDLFPYVYLSKSIMKIAGYQLRAYLVYRRTLQRPVYEQLNPFPRYVDQYLSEVGNPSLRPQFSKNYEFNVSFEETPVLAVGFNDTKDAFTNVIYQADTSLSQAYRTYDNLGKNKEWYFRALGALPPGRKYFFVMGVQYNHNFYDGLYEGKPLSYKRGTWMMFTYHMLKLDKRSQVTLNGFVRFRGLLQFTEVKTFGGTSFNINRKFLKEKLTVTLSVNDIFYTNKYDFSIKQGTLNAYGLRRNDTRRFGINFRYNFGFKKKEEYNPLKAESPENQ